MSTVPDATSSPADQAAQKAERATVARLSSLKGAEFDREFLSAIVKEEAQEVGTLETEMKTASDPTLTATMSGILAVSEAHELEAITLEHSGATPAPSTPH